MLEKFMLGCCLIVGKWTWTLIGVVAVVGALLAAGFTYVHFSEEAERVALLQKRMERERKEGLQGQIEEAELRDAESLALRVGVLGQAYERLAALAPIVDKTASMRQEWSDALATAAGYLPGCLWQLQELNTMGGQEAKIVNIVGSKYRELKRERDNQIAKAEQELKRLKERRAVLVKEQQKEQS